MNRIRKALLISAAALLCMVTGAPDTQAAPPKPIAYQGYLTSKAGVPVDGTLKIVFSLYNGPGEAAQLWTETQDVTVVKGNYNVFLGNSTALDLPFDSEYWLGVRVSDDSEMTPRALLTHVPNAFRAVTAGTVTGAIAGSQVTGTITTATVSGSQVTGVITGATISGSQITGAIPGATPWVVVSGSSQQAVSNSAYLVTGATPATITLPPSPAAGDVVKVSSPGAGGFTLAPNAGQTISGGNNVAFVTWTPRGNAIGWNGVASSADGKKLVATGDRIYTSTDSGVTWTARESATIWLAVASSSDGTKLVVAAGNPTGSLVGQIYTSTDSGVTWVPRDSARRWTAVASSSDGTKLVASAHAGRIYTSTDSGVTWTPRESVRQWRSIGSSADGTKLAAGVDGGQIYTSVDSGVTWTPRGIVGGWWWVASSADGTKLAAVDFGGQIYTSIDSGVTWTARESARNWSTIASSSDGTKLAAAVGALVSGQIYTSTDSGVTWAARESARDWRAIASSADGGKLVAVTGDGQIYTAPSATLSSGQFSVVELVYAGNSQWIVVSQQGSLASP